MSATPLDSVSKDNFPKPKSIEGGCLCGALRYRVEFPEGHDFKEFSGTCQCTQCRKNTSSLFFIYHRVEPASAFRWTSNVSSLRNYYASPGNQRAFCAECGSFMYWHPEGGNHYSLAVGTIDPLYLFGEGADGITVPKEGYGLALAGCGGGHEWCGNEIPGVTDAKSMPLLTRGERVVNHGE